MAQLLDARDPGLRLVRALGLAALCAAFAVAGVRLAAAAEVEVNLDVLKTLPAGKSGGSGKAIKLTPPKAKQRNVGRREEALRRARKRRLIEQAKRRAAARKRAEAKKKAEAARKAAAKKKADEARKAEEAKQAAEMGRRAKAEREAEAARKAAAAKKAEAARKAAQEKAAAGGKAAKATAEKRRATNDAATKRKVTAKTTAKTDTKAASKPKTTSGADKKQVATRRVRPPLVRERLLFGKESAKLSPAAQDKLAPIAEKMVKQSQARLVIYAYAAGDGTNLSDVRRLSLSRALAVRRAIMGRGIPATRTEIRALGDRAGGGPSDRVDLVLVPR